MNNLNQLNKLTMKTTIRACQQKNEDCLFHIQETGNWFYHDTKRRVGAVKSQINKNMKIIFYRETTLKEI